MLIAWVADFVCFLEELWTYVILSDLLGPMSSLSVFAVSGYLDLYLKGVIVQEESCGVYVYGVLCSIVRIIEIY